MARHPKPPEPPREHPERPVSDLAREALAEYVAADPVSVRLLEQIRRIAAVESTVLLQGESGAGKDMAASLLHYLGRAPGEPLVKIDCASLPHALVESELFGYERGAFTGATHAKRGRLELAGGGTLLLDEVTALSPAVQAKFLRALEERSFLRLGGTRAVRVEARIVAMTSADLEAAVRQGAFREDLYYRLNVVPLRVPALRERPGDVRHLAVRFLEQLGARTGRAHLRLDPAALSLLQSCGFPGNVRELRNLLERAVVRSEHDVLTVADFPASLKEGDHEARMKSLAEMEREHIAAVLEAVRGKKSRAAEVLGISRKNLLEKRKRYGLM
jgi:two-component system response regulator AtoC